MKIVHYASGEAEARDHPWVPGGVFIGNPHLESLLRALEESGIETAEQFKRRLMPTEALPPSFPCDRLRLGGVEHESHLHVVSYHDDPSTVWCPGRNPR